MWTYPKTGLMAREFRKTGSFALRRRRNGR
jgi:hypothetical protein